MIDNKYLLINDEWAFSVDHISIVLYRFIRSEEGDVYPSVEGYYSKWSDALFGAIDKRIRYEDLETLADIVDKLEEIKNEMVELSKTIENSV